MKKLLSLLFASLFVAIGAFSQTTWKLDNVHSSVKFSVSHLVISEVEGNFKKFSANLAYSKPDFSDAIVDFAVDVNSINTESEGRDKHLRSDDFFNAEKYPQMTFKGTSWKKNENGKYTLEGDLTIRDITKKVAFNVTDGGTIKDPWGNTKQGFKATATINRFDYNLKWNTITEAGGAVVGKEVDIILNLEFAKEKPGDRKS